MAPPTRIAVLLRGVNVGRAKRIPMSELASIVEGVGGRDVRTLLNSGNAVCTIGSPPDRVAAAVSASIEQRLGFTCDVIVRTKPQIEAVVALDPLADVATDPSRYLVVFLGSRPDPAAVEALRAFDVAPEQWRTEGGELYAWFPAGVADSLVVKQLARGALGVTWTGRNWNTVTRLRDLL